MNSRTNLKAAVLTGAAGGIGRAMVRGLLDAGWSVLAVDRNAGALDALVDQRQAHPRLAILCTDLALDASAAAVAARALALFGRVDALINNAGLNMMSHRNSAVTLRPRFWEVESEVFRLFFEINAGAPFRLAAALAPHMLAAGAGRIVNVTTSLVSMLAPGMHPYGPTKAAAEALSAVMAADLEGTGVTVNVLVPGGPVDTPMVGNYPPVARELFLQPEVMVPPLLWLLDDADAGSGRRYIARLWNPALPSQQAAAMAGAPLAWSTMAGSSWNPGAR